MASLKRKENGNKQSQNSPQKKGAKPQTRQNAITRSATHARSNVAGKFCGPVIQVTFKRIKAFAMLFVVLMLITVIFSVILLYKAIEIRTHLGAIINMISSGDGEVLPCLLALPVFLFLCLNTAIIFYVYNIFSKKKSPRSNRFLFILILVALGVVSVINTINFLIWEGLKLDMEVAITLAIIFATLKQLYDPNKYNEDGIIKAMEKYAVDSFYKKQIDRLQIGFQCCGSNKYDDWYNISWLEKAVLTK